MKNTAILTAHSIIISKYNPLPLILLSLLVQSFGDVHPSEAVIQTSLHPHGTEHLDL